MPTTDGQAHLTDAEIRFLVGAASTLAERLSGGVVPSGDDHASAARRLARWKRLAANDDAVVFRRALDALGIGGASDEQLCGLLGEAQPPPGSDLPRWAGLLREIVPAVSAAFLNESGPGTKASRAAGRSLPFSDLYAPVVALARQKVATLRPRHADRLHETAWQSVERHLIHRISTVCSLALQPKFLAFAAVRRAGSMPSSYFGDSPGGVGEANPSLFRAFVQAQGRGGLRAFFLQHPVAARLVAQVTLFWIDFVTEFLGRLAADTDEISARFFHGNPVGKIDRIRAGVSDPHHGGKSVLLLGFEGGERLVYKPRPVGIDAAFCDGLTWLNARGYRPALRSLDVLVRGGYGWENFVRHTPCGNQRDAGQFYQRAGALLYLIHRLRGTDMHCENVIATTEGPVVVDLEALCHPTMPLVPSLMENQRGEKWVFDSSVFRTGMLPMPAPRSERARSGDLSAMGAVIHRRTADHVRWKHVNSDRMEAVTGVVRGVLRTHRPHLWGRPLAAHGYREDLIKGFAEMSRFLGSDEALFKEWQARVAGMYALETRLIRQRTMSYMAMIEHSLQPALLVSGIDRSIELRGRPLIPGSEPSNPAEAAALEVLDVPYFVRGPTVGASAAIASDDETELTGQIAAIRASFGTEKLTVHHHPSVARELTL